MNLNSLILTNIQGSPYFKVKLFALKTYHEVVDEIYYKVTHLEPWEVNSRKTSGQTGMCGGVRGVGAGGIVSSAFCLLYKLFTLKLTRKQLTGMINHADSPYIRGLGFMYARYTLPPPDLWEWFSYYLNDEEEIDVKAGGGNVIFMGDMCRDFLLKLDWYGALFPRIPVPVQKIIKANMEEYGPSIKEQYHLEHLQEEEARLAKEREERQKKEEERRKQRHESDERRTDTRRYDDYSRELERERSRQQSERPSKRKRDDRSRERRRSRSNDRRRSRSNDRRRSRSYERHRSDKRSDDRRRDHKRRSRSRERKSSHRQR